MDFTAFYASFGQDSSEDPVHILSRAAAIGFDGHIELEPFLFTGGVMYSSKIWKTMQPLMNLNGWTTNCKRA